MKCAEAEYGASVRSLDTPAVNIIDSPKPMGFIEQAAISHYLPVMLMFTRKSMIILTGVSTIVAAGGSIV